MARKREHYDNIFAETNVDKFMIEAVNAQSSLYAVSNPYVGNKRKILADIGKTIYENLRYNEIETVCDLFAGSSVVGSFFKILGKKVCFNELLMSSYMHGVSLHSSFEYPISKEDWDFLVNNKNKNSDKFIESKYVDKKFTQKECEFIDNYFANCCELYKDFTNVRYCVAQSTIMQFIMSHCFVGGRLNGGQIIAVLDHRLQHQRNNNSEMNFSKMEPFYFECKGPSTDSYQGDVFDFLNKNKKKIDLIYIDPPYGGQQSDYAFMYQFFEEYLSRKEYSEIEYLKQSSKRFSKTNTYKESFDDLLKNLPNSSYWAISYNDSSWSDIEEIVDMVGRYKKIISVKEIKYSYKYRSADNVSGVEYLLIGQ